MAASSALPRSRSVPRLHEEESHHGIRKKNFKVTDISIS